MTTFSLPDAEVQGMAKLNETDIRIMSILAEHGESQTVIAQRLGVSEGAVRYHLRGRDGRSEDGRAKTALIDQCGLTEVVHGWWQESCRQLPAGRSPNATELHLWLQEEHGYTGSVKSVRKYIRQHLTRPPLRPFRRVETPPGVQAQVDWSEYRDVDCGDGGPPCTLYVFHMTLSHSRYQVDIVCRGCDQLWWHTAHLAAFERLGGVPAVLRIDNLKTGIGSGSGTSGQVNAQYAAFAKALGFHVDACQPRQPQQKGKVERGVRTFRLQEHQFRHMAVFGLEALQDWMDQQAQRRGRTRSCPVTGTSVEEAWKAEKTLLQMLPPHADAPFDVCVMRKVSRDCLVHFEGRQYAVPFAYTLQEVEVRGLAETVLILDSRTGSELMRYARRTPERLLIDSRCYEGERTATVLPPVPLGALAQRIADLQVDQVERRSVDWYAELAEVAG